MAKKVRNDYPFYEALKWYYQEYKNQIKRNYKLVTKKFLDFNDKTKNPNAFLRTPQFEALEMYVFVKEYLNNDKVKNMFSDWYNRKNKFDSRENFSSGKRIGGFVQRSIFDDLTAEVYNDVFDMLNNEEQKYPNYIYALTMGTGKTILMATCIFYEFILASKFPKDDRFCHNALVFAPDKTVLQSLKEIQTFDLFKVVPSEYAHFLSTNIKFHYLDDTSTTLNTINDSDFNIIISNTQKIILKEVHKEKSAVDQFMNDDYGLFEKDDFISSLYSDLVLNKDEKEVVANQRFEKIIRLNQLGVYVDEAHHLFGSDLKKSLSDSSKETSLRYTINKIAEALEKRSTKLVACFNYTGTPYVENRVLPEVVYGYGLKEAISNRYLKQVEVKAYDNVKNEEFLKKAIKDFFDYHKDNLYEGLKPKMAIFGTTIDEINNDIKPMVEAILNDLGIDTSTILVNVGDSATTKDSDIRNFNNLDIVGTEGANKQIILLVNKGREGWNCRSLFSVALFRSPKSKIFVLQSTMRCLRSITDRQQLAHIYLSKENYDILDSELKKNFNVDISSVTEKNPDNKKEYSIKIVDPVKELTIKELTKFYGLIEKNIENTCFKFDISKTNLEKYKSKMIIKKGIDDRFAASEQEFISEENRTYSKYTIVFEVARYLNISPIKVKEILDTSGMFDEIQNVITMYNEVLYDELIPQLFNYLYYLKEETITKTKVVPLIKYPQHSDHFIFRSKENMTIEMNDPLISNYADKSFHTDRYCFDSEPEKRLFLQLLESPDVSEVYFTGMFTGAENGLSVQYIDPDSNLIRNYYPDILVYYKDGIVEVIEVKGDNAIDDRIVEAKAMAALDKALQSNMDYNIIKSSDIMNGKYNIRTLKK